MRKAQQATFGEFDKAKEVWLSYTERVQQYFEANEIKTAKKQHTVLLSVCRPTMYQLIQNLSYPQKPTELEFSALVELVQRHKNPQPSVIVRRFAFHSHQQQPGETVAAFVAELKKLSDDCKFGENLQVMLRDRLVCGIWEPSLQRRLLVEADLTSDKVFVLCQAFEAAERDTKDIQSSQNTRIPVHHVKSTKKASSAECYRCLGEHLPKECPFQEAICHNCSKRGRIWTACRASGQSKQKVTIGKGNVKTVQNMEAHDSSAVLTVPNDSYMLFQVSDPKRISISVDILIEGYEVQMEVDTGAAVSVISEDTLKSLPKEMDVHPSQVNLKSYTGEPIPTVGQVLVRVQYKNQSEDNLCLIVTKGDGSNLLGRNWLQHFKLDWPNLCQVACTPQADLIQKYAELSKDEFGCLCSQEADIVMPTDAMPIFCRPRPVPHALQDKIERELECLQEADVIEPVDHTDWATLIVPVLKPDAVFEFVEIIVSQSTRLPNSAHIHYPE